MTYPKRVLIAAALIAARNATTIPVDIRKVNNIQVKGSGTPADPWNPI